MVNYRIGEKGGYVLQSCLITKVYWRKNGVRKVICVGRGSKDLPKIILLDGANGVDSGHVGLNTEDLQPQTGSFLNDLVGMISVLRRYGVGLPLDIGGDVLMGCQQ